MTLSKGGISRDLRFRIEQMSDTATYLAVVGVLIALAIAGLAVAAAQIRGQRHGSATVPFAIGVGGGTTLAIAALLWTGFLLARPGRRSGGGGASLLIVAMGLGPGVGALQPRWQLLFVTFLASKLGTFDVAPIDLPGVLDGPYTARESDFPL